MLGHCVFPVSLQSRSSRPLTYLVWCATFQTAWFLVLLKQVRWRKRLGLEVCPKCSKKFKCFSAGIYEDESGIMMKYYANDCYACDVCSKEEEVVLVLNVMSNDIWDAIFTFICKLEYIRIWPCSALTKFSLSERY